MFSKIEVELIDHMGTDASTVNAARVSFNKRIEGDIDEKDRRLIRYLARHNHWTCFGHSSLSFRIKAPLFVARQLGKHQVGLVWNEVSRRYVSYEPEVYRPDTWRAKAENVKQGSAEEPVANQHVATDKCIQASKMCLKMYEELLAMGVCPEQARMVLPQNMMTEWVWTGSLAAFARVCALRLDPHTQKETRDVASAIAYAALDLFPVSFGAMIYEDRTT